MLKRAAALLLVCASAATWTSCGSNLNNYVYAAIPASSQIVVFREDPNSGVLTRLSTSPISAGPGVQALVIHPSKKYVYAVNSAENDISLYTVNSGTLVETGPRTSVLPATGPNLVAMDSAGSYLYVGDAGSGTVSVFSIASDGSLSEVLNSPFNTGITALNLALSPSGNVLYVTGTQGSLGQVEAFSINAGVLGAPLANSPYLTGSNPNGLVINSAGNFLYTANSAPDNSISQFTINSDGSLGPATIIGGGGLLSPSALFIDKSGKFLYVADDNSTGSVIAYSIGSDGGLTLLTTFTFGTGPNPNEIAGDPSGNYLFVGNQSTPTIQSFNLNTSSGALTSVGTYPVTGTPTSIVVLH
ncbi:MAG: beta-propeller fold lactonase family protein [Candidatus Sulfotelmatobacter sp.]